MVSLSKSIFAALTSTNNAANLVWVGVDTLLHILIYWKTLSSTIDHGKYWYHVKLITTINNTLHSEMAAINKLEMNNLFYWRKITWHVWVLEV